MRKFVLVIWVLVFVLSFSSEIAFAKRKRSGRKYFPPLTHPVVLWSITLADGPDFEQRKVAAFKLSQYSQSIYQEEVINTLLKCLKDPDEHIKVFCTKALGKATGKSKDEIIRKSLIEQYKTEPHLRGTLIRTFSNRKDSHPLVQETLLSAIQESTDLEEVLPALEYFEQFGGSKAVDPLVILYNKSDNVKIKRGIVKVLAERGQGQDSVISILADCVDSKDTTLVLNCLSALQVQARKDSKTLTAVEKTLESSDPDVVLATLELIQSLPESPNEKISTRLLELIQENSENDMVEKSILALGVCGTHSESVVKALQASLEKKSSEEGIRISAALSLGKQAYKFPDGPRSTLNDCKSSVDNSKSLITACQLALKELQNRTAKAPSLGQPESKNNATKAPKKAS